MSASLLAAAPVLAHGSGADDAAFVLAPVVVLGVLVLVGRYKGRRAEAAHRRPADQSGP